MMTGLSIVNALIIFLKKLQCSIIIEFIFILISLYQNCCRGKETLLLAERLLVISAGESCSFAILLTHGDSGHRATEQGKRNETENMLDASCSKG